MAPGNPQTPRLKHSTSGGGQLFSIGVGTWRLEIPAGKAGIYRLAQMDDYSERSRDHFPWLPPLALQLEARASSREALPGTWGFGLWNDPFSLSLGMGGGTRRFPALPNCAWFFFASPENYLSLRDDLPANGALAATFRSRRQPSPLLALGGLALPLLAVPFTRASLRRAGRSFVLQDAQRIKIDASAWHAYRIAWQSNQAAFFVDETPVLNTEISPDGPLGLVLWVDNQYAALPPDSPPRYGTLENPQPAWIEVRNIALLDNHPTYM